MIFDSIIYDSSDGGRYPTLTDAFEMSMLLSSSIEHCIK